MSEPDPKTTLREVQEYFDGARGPKRESHRVCRDVPELHVINLLKGSSVVQW
jgi:hypothetical protein